MHACVRQEQLSLPPSLFSLKPPACGLQLGLWGVACCTLCPRRSDSSRLHQPPTPSSSQGSTLFTKLTLASPSPNAYGGCTLHSAYWSQLLHRLLSHFSNETSSSHVEAQWGLPKTLLSRRRKWEGQEPNMAVPTCSPAAVSPVSQEKLNVGEGGWLRDH